MIQYNPFPVLETTHLLLRQMTYHDTENLYDMRKDLRMHAYTDTKPDQTLDDTRNYIEKMNKGISENKWIVWAIEHKSSCKVIGSISIWNINWEEETAELGYGICPDYQGKGLMKEALLEAVAYGFGIMRLKSLEAYTEADNLSSVKLLESCHFNEVSRVDDKGYLNDRVYHMVVYSLEQKQAACNGLE